MGFLPRENKETKEFYDRIWHHKIFTRYISCIIYFFQLIFAYYNIYMYICLKIKQIPL
mgnify:CR=1 FL=1